MFASRISEAKRQGCYVLSDNGTQSYDTRVVSSVADIAPGTPLMESAPGDVLVFVGQVPGAGKGVLTMAAEPTSGAVPEGTYNIFCIEPAANGGTFHVERPDGTLDGIATVGVAYAGAINFTIADGATDFVAGDRAGVAVSYEAGTGVLVPADLSVSGGNREVVGILDAPIWAASIGTSERIAVLARNAEVIDHEMTWPGEPLAAQAKAEIKRQLAEKLIIVRG
ncbi:hypothetical protein [Bosea sp. (in: a-proteobacteria)]|uniref:hypothetical protein n=1 Tax=Bosea sp. (in: a-proteobacteria) TaxID=1871050 RepID=UPI002732F63D|nr:hypothetical protein [Bosea sp. (in: a-proteobacteria)]MDP3408078.1 hypothetical protein [Bosea sp. (in: a-proteobacteria)]